MFTHMHSLHTCTHFTFSSHLCFVKADPPHCISDTALRALFSWRVWSHDPYFTRACISVGRSWSLALLVMAHTSSDGNTSHKLQRQLPSSSYSAFSGGERDEESVCAGILIAYKREGRFFPHLRSWRLRGNGLWKGDFNYRPWDSSKMRNSFFTWVAWIWGCYFLCDYPSMCSWIFFLCRQWEREWSSFYLLWSGLYVRHFLLKGFSNSASLLVSTY